MAKFKTLKKYVLGDMVAHFYLSDENQLEWSLYPQDEEEKFVYPKYQKNAFSLVQAKLFGDAYDKNFSNGMTMFNSETARKIKFVKQEKIENNKSVLIISTLQDQHGNLYHQYVKWEKSSQRVLLWADFKNCQQKTVCLEYLSSFVLNSLSPFSSKNISGNLDVIRFHSKWSMEGRIEQNPIEYYDLEKSWKPSGLSLLQFGQNGTMPVRRFFPILGLQDHQENTTWLVELDARASWQIDLARIDDRLTMYGGLPDRDSGYWFKKVKPHETYTTPVSYMTVGHGDLLRVSRNLQAIEKKNRLPVLYNEWATTWGHPTYAQVHKALPLLKRHGVSYYIIDAGWYCTQNSDFNRCLGDWKINKESFPEGFKAVTDEIHQAGLKAGIWYEFEGVGDLSNNYSRSEFLAKRNGWPVTTMKRRFLDLRKSTVKNYLDHALIDTLVKNNFDYLKVDYNDSLGIGIDGSDSPAEGLQENITETLNIFKKLHQIAPYLEIESCSSGGHRLVPSFIENSDFDSFSDAHETLSIPIIAANELNILPPVKNLIWCVVNHNNSIDLIQYRLLASFLGRVCLSGDICKLTNKQWRVIDQGLNFYQKNADLVSGGFPFRFGPEVLSYQNPTGYQIICFSNQKSLEDSNKLLLIIHKFSGEIKKVNLPFKLDQWHIVTKFGNKDFYLDTHNSKLILAQTDFSAVGLTLEKDSF